MPKDVEGREFESLYRRLPIPVKDAWEEVEKRVAAKHGIVLGSKLETPGGWAALYELMGQHFLQMSDADWRNF